MPRKEKSDDRKTQQNKRRHPTTTSYLAEKDNLQRDTINFDHYNKI